MCCVVAVRAEAGNWIGAGTDLNMATFVDQDSIQKVDEHVSKAIAKSYFNPPLTRPPEGVGMGKYRIYADCVSMALDEMPLEYYSPSGKKLQSLDEREGPHRWRPTQPDTVSRFTANVICNQPPPVSPPLFKEGDLDGVAKRLFAR